MKPTVASLLALVLFGAGPALADQSSELARVIQYELRESGLHAVFLSAPIPDEGCDRIDRAILDPRSRASDAFLESIRSANTNNRLVRLRVDGCIQIDFGTLITAPRVIKVDVN